MRTALFGVTQKVRKHPLGEQHPLHIKASQTVRISQFHDPPDALQRADIIRQARNKRW